MSTQEIQRIVQERDIQYLVHFTRICNLDGILEHGIYPHSRLDELPHNVTINDAERWDYHTDSISLSIAFPNYLMFYKYRMESDDAWVVIIIHPSVIWESPCAFCKHNAADRRISSLSVTQIGDHYALAGMFAEIEGHRSREEQKLKPCDPTDPQAEILIFDVVSPAKIHGVVFSNKDLKVAYAQKHPDLKMYHHPDNKGLFASRNYVREYN